jgi:hypothetical protein
MIATENIAPGVLKIVVPETLRADDFRELGPQIEAIMKQYGQLRLLIDASRMEGWDKFATVEKHAAFVKAHQAKVERVAIIARHDWQHWLVGAVHLFLHPEVRVFDPGHEDEAARWIGHISTNGAADVVSSFAGEATERRVSDIADGH